jgi:hypothetical protein
MPLIEIYSFGRMVIKGSLYARDVVIFPDGRVLSPWWRKEADVLAAVDLAELLAAGPEIIICGTGAMGLMQPAAGLEKYLAARNIEFIARKSSHAVATYNEISGSAKVGACFHLTC